MILQVKNFLRDNITVKKLNAFYESIFHPALISLIILISYMLKGEVVGVCLCLFIVSVGLIVCKDLKPIIPLLLGFIMFIPYKNGFIEGSNLYVEYVLGYLPYIIIFSSFLIISIVAHFVLWGGFIKIFTKPSKLLLYSLPFAFFICFNGVFNKNYTISNLIFALVTVFCLIGLYAIFLNNLTYDQKTINYFFKCCACLAFVFIGEYLFICFTQNVINNGKIYKHAINLGWGNPNNYGNYGCYLLPAIFYLAYASKKKWHFVLYYVLGSLTYAFTFLSLSRNAILTGTILMIFICIFLCKNGEYKSLFKKLLLYTLISIAILFVIYLMLAFGFKVATKLFEDITYSGVSDNGRFKLWGEAFNAFLAYPLFGQGFYGCEFMSWTGFIPGMYHNTFFQILGTGGILTLLAYGLYRYKTIKVILYKLNSEKIFLGLMVFVLIFSSLFDNFIFHIYPTFFYSIAIAFCDLHYEKEKRLENNLLKI